MFSFSLLSTRKGFSSPWFPYLIIQWCREFEKIQSLTFVKVGFKLLDGKLYPLISEKGF